jgi:hypothetical protein
MQANTNLLILITSTNIFITIGLIFLGEAMQRHYSGKVITRTMLLETITGVTRLVMPITFSNMLVKRYSVEHLQEKYKTCYALRARASFVLAGLLAHPNQVLFKSARVRVQKLLKQIDIYMDRLDAVLTTKDPDHQYTGVGVYMEHYRQNLTEDK